MKSSTVSSKYQIVVPKALRKQIDIKPGQKVYLRIKNKDTLELKVGSEVKKAFGSMKELWGSDPDKYLRELRDEANRDRT